MECLLGVEDKKFKIWDQKVNERGTTTRICDQKSKCATCSQYVERCPRIVYGDLKRSCDCNRVGSPFQS